MPTPWSVSPRNAGTWIENGLAPELKVMESMVTLAERVGEVCVEVPKVAVSPALTGANPGGTLNQLPPVFQVAEAGALSQVASTASEEEGRRKKEEVRSKKKTRSFLPDNIERGKPEMTAEGGSSVCKSAPNAQDCFAFVEQNLRELRSSRYSDEIRRKHWEPRCGNVPRARIRNCDSRADVAAAPFCALRIPAHPFPDLSGYELTILSKSGFDDAHG